MFRFNSKSVHIDDCYKVIEGHLASTRHVLRSTGNIKIVELFIRVFRKKSNKTVFSLKYFSSMMFPQGINLQFSQEENMTRPLVFQIEFMKF